MLIISFNILCGKSFIKDATFTSVPEILTFTITICRQERKTIWNVSYKTGSIHCNARIGAFQETPAGITGGESNDAYRIQIKKKLLQEI